MTQLIQRPTHSRKTLPSAPSMAGMTVNVLESDGTVALAYSNGVEWLEGANLTATQLAATQALVSGAGVVVDSTAAAAANTAALQAALTAGGIVNVIGRGVCWINDTLTIYSDTTLTVQAGLTLRMVSGAGGKPVLQNFAYSQRAAGTTVTVTWSAGTSASVAWTAHGLAVGDCFRLQGATLSVFNLVAQVLTVTDANNVVIELNYVPTGAVSGTITAVKCDRNITVDCQGTLDYNHPANTTGGSNLFSCCTHLALIRNLRVKALNVVNAEKYCLQTAGLRDSFIDNVAAPVTNSDIVKAYGPMQAVQFSNISGNCGDDGLSFQPYEDGAYPNFQWSRGDMINCRLDGTNIRTRLSAGGLVVLYPNAVDKMIGIRVSNVGGATDTGSAVRVTGQTSGACVVNDLEVAGITAKCRYGLYFNQSGSATQAVRKLRATGIAPQPVGSTTVAFLMAGSTTVDDGEVEFALDDPLWTGGAYAAQFNGTYQRMHLKGSLKGGVTCRGVNMTAVQTGNLIMSLSQRTGDQMVGGAQVSGTITLQGCDTSIANVISTSGATGPVNVNLLGNRFNNASGGVVRSTSTVTFNIRGSGNDFQGTSLLAVAPSGTPTFNVYGSELPADIGATGFNKTTAGQHCFNTGTGRGTIAQNRLVICNGTNWLQADNLANTF